MAIETMKCPDFDNFTGFKYWNEMRSETAENWSPYKGLSSKRKRSIICRDYGDVNDEDLATDMIS